MLFRKNEQQNQPLAKNTHKVAPPPETIPENIRATIQRQAKALINASMHRLAQSSKRIPDWYAPIWAKHFHADAKIDTAQAAIEAQYRQILTDDNPQVCFARIKEGLAFLEGHIRAGMTTLKPLQNQISERR